MCFEELRSFCGSFELEITIKVGECYETAQYRSG